MYISRRDFLKGLARGAAGSVLAVQASSLLPAANATQSPPASELVGLLQGASHSRLPRWRGFNLLEKFTLGKNQPYQEWDFDFLAQWGFDFVRLPTDYRIWTVSPGVYREPPLREIDQAIAWARARRIHVSLNLHRAPGKASPSIPPPEPLNLWSEGADGQEARRQFAMQWRMFATRYRGILGNELSFNLVNEPPDIPGTTYLRVVAAAVEAIRAEDAERLIIADGLSSGTRPVPELVSLRIAQSTRGYQPFAVSHYQADWLSGIIGGIDSLPTPTWPIPVAINQYLYGDHKRPFQSPMILRGEFAEAARLSIRVNLVTTRATLRIRADGATVFEKLFVPGPGEGEWKRTIFRPEYNIYQAIYDRDYIASIPAGTREVRIEITSGDWLTFSEIRIAPYPRSPNQVVLGPVDLAWAVRQSTYILQPSGGVLPIDSQRSITKETLWRQHVEPWKRLADSGVGVHVGEWGAYNRTPHAVVLAWMRDCLENWKQAGLGWALWNLRGPFGVVDSERSDAAYEDHKGHKLDRRMLEVLLEG